MTNIVKNYKRILEVITPLSIGIFPNKKTGRKPKMPDIQVVVLSLTAEYMSIDTENLLFKRLTNAHIPNLI